MEVILSKKAQQHIAYWKKTKNLRVQKRISELLKSIINSPYKGIGKPEPLRNQLSGLWSRRIDKKNRFVYSVKNNIVHIYSLKGHY